MMKITNEIKIAVVAILGIVIMFFGMQFLKGLADCRHPVLSMPMAIR